MRTTTRSLRAAGLLLAATLLATACGGTADAPSAAIPDPTDATTGDDPTTNPEPTQIVVAASPALATLGLHAADDLGYFAEAGLELEFVRIVDGNTTVPSLLSGDTHFAMLGMMEVISARANSVPVRAVAPLYVMQEPEGNRGFGTVLVRSDGPIQDVLDLQGAKIGVHAVRSEPWLAVRESVDLAGGDSSTIEFVEVPIPQMASALQQNQVDAIVIAEPFTGAALMEHDNFRPLMAVHHSAVGSPSMALLASEAFLAESPAVAKAFHDALMRGNAEVNADPELAYRIAIERLQVPEPLMADVVYPLLAGPEAFDADLIAQVIERMVTYGLVDESAAPDPADTTANLA